MSNETTLNVLKQGISRIREKGGADPSTLYDLLNGYVTIDGSVKSRPGTDIDTNLPAGTKGLMVMDGAFLVFSNVPTTITDPAYSAEVLVNPNDPTLAIKEIHFAAPFLGFPYVVAEFSNGSVWHYWLQKGKPWSATTFYTAGDIVEPTTPNGLAYRATRDGPALPSWAPNVARAVSDKVEPTVYNDYFYTVIEVDGTNPASGATEPLWPTSSGAQVIEDTNGPAGDGTTITPPPPANQPGSGTTDRYGDPGSFKTKLSNTSAL